VTRGFARPVARTLLRVGLLLISPVGLWTAAGSFASPLLAQQSAGPGPSAGAPPRMVWPDPSPSGAAGQYVVQSWTVASGLPVNGIQALHQGPDGYIWVATTDGLARFDGVRFTLFRTSGTAELPTNRIASILGTRDGTLWLRTDRDDLVRLHRGRFRDFGKEAGIPFGVRALFEDRRGRLWAGTEGSVGFLSEAGYSEVAVLDADTSPVVIGDDRDGTIWFATDTRELFRLVGAEGPAQRVDSLGRGRPRVLLSDRAGGVWIGDGGAVRLHRGTTTVALDLPEPPSLLFAADPSGNGGWVIGASTVHRLDPSDARLLHTHPRGIPGAAAADSSGTLWYGIGSTLYREGNPVLEVTGPDGELPGQARSITSIVHDRDGSVWLGTYGAGMRRVAPSRFRVYGEPEGLPEGNVYPILEDRLGAVWVGTWGRGVAQLEGDRIVGIGSDQGAPAFVTSIFEDRAGRLWLGGIEAGLRLCPRTPGRRSCTAAAGTEGWEANVRAVFEDASGTLWLGSSEGLYRYDGRTLTLVEEAGRARVRVFHQTADGALWMGTNGDGLLRLKEGVWERITTEEGLPGNLVRALHEDVEGWLWVGLEGSGLARLDARRWGMAEASPTVGISARDGLYDDVIHQILPDDEDRLWMSTNRGIFRVERSALHAFAEGREPILRSTSYTETDGLRSREANGGVQSAGTRAADGRLWFPTQAGVVVVDPADFPSDVDAPTPVIEGVGVPGETLPAGGDAVRLNVGQRDVQISYAAPEFAAPEGLRFRYRLDPYDDGWVDAGVQRTAFYTRLPPGVYTFRVAAASENGVWREAAEPLRLEVAPRFVETLYFRVPLALALLGVLALLFRWRTASLRLRALALEGVVEKRTASLRAREGQLAEQNARLATQANELEALDRAKTSFFANISHELRTPLTLTIGPLERARMELPQGAEPIVAAQVDLALTSSRRLLQLVDQILDLTRLEARYMPLRAQPLDLIGLVRGILAAFGSLADQGGVELASELPDGPVEVWADPDSLEKILLNLLSNAFKFTPRGGRVVLRVRIDSGEGNTQGDASEWVRLDVTDSGQGIPEAELSRIFERFHRVEGGGRPPQPGAGIGLALARELTELHGGELSVASAGADAGATFTLSLRLGSDHLRPDQRVETPIPIHPVPGASADSAGAWMPLPPPMGSDPDAGALRDEDRTTLLVVDDNADLRAFLRSTFEPLYRVIEAADGIAALECARTELPDLIVSDLVMPGMDGHALCRALRASPDTDFIPVLLLTAVVDQEERIQALDGGADDYLTKPFALRELEVRVANLIAARRRLIVRLGGSSGGAGGGRVVDDLPGDQEIAAADRALLERVQSALEARIADPDFSVGELAKVVLLDRSHLSRKLSELLGESPSDMIRRLRLERAAALLVGSSEKISEVAYASGFNGVSYFCRVFRERYGVTPAAFRGGERGQGGSPPR